MEVEILSPFQPIEPGQAASFRIEWGACRCPGPIVDVTRRRLCRPPVEL